MVPYKPSPTPSIKLPTTIQVAEVYPSIDPKTPELCMFRCDIISRNGFLAQSTPVYGQGYCSEGLKIGAEIDTRGMSVREKLCCDGKARLWLVI